MLSRIFHDVFFCSSPDRLFFSAVKNLLIIIMFLRSSLLIAGTTMLATMMAVDFVQAQSPAGRLYLSIREGKLLQVGEFAATTTPIFLGMPRLCVENEYTFWWATDNPNDVGSVEFSLLDNNGLSPDAVNILGPSKRCEEAAPFTMFTNVGSDFDHENLKEGETYKLVIKEYVSEGCTGDDVGRGVNDIEVIDCEDPDDV